MKSESNIRRAVRFSISVIVLALIIVLASLSLASFTTRDSQNVVADVLPTSPAPKAALIPAPAEGGLIAVFEQTLGSVYRATVPSVVNIRATQIIDASLLEPFVFPFPYLPSPDTPYTPDQYYGQSEGSGFVWDDEGHIVTNYHLVAKATEIEVTFADGVQFKAVVRGADPEADLAVLSIDSSGREFYPLPLADSNALEPGQLAIAIGNPFGQEFTMTSGIISAVGRTIPTGYSQFSIPEVIQTDAPINPGNSGGPLLNYRGEVIGINTQMISQSGSSAGIGFAIPSNIARQVIPTLIRAEAFEYPWLGISGATMTPELAELMGLPADTRGALIVEVIKAGPADEAGLQGSARLQTTDGFEYQAGGDVILSINNQPISEINDVITYLVDETRPGDKVIVSVLRADGRQAHIPVTLGVRPR